MSSNPVDGKQLLKDVNPLHEGLASSETAISFDHVTKTYRLYKTDCGRFLACSILTAGASI